MIPPRYNWASSFSEGVAAVCQGACRNVVDGKASIQYIDRRGKVVLSPGLPWAGDFSEGLAAAKLGSGVMSPYGYIDRTGKFAIYPRYTRARDFSEGLAATDDGYINRSGDLVIARVPATQVNPMKIERSLILSYPFVIRPLDAADGGGFAIEYPDLPGCISDGETPEETLRNGQDAVKAYLSSCAKHGDPLPKPGSASGQWRQRVPRSLHARLVARARQEGVSLNSLVTAMIAEGLGRRRAS